MASEPPTPFRLDDEDIGEIGEGRVVGDDPGETDLASVAIEAEGERVVDRPLQDVEGDARRPVRTGEKIMDQGEIEPRLVGIDLAGAAPARDRLGRKGGIAVGHDRLRSACGSGGSGGGTASPREAAGAGNSALGERAPGAVSGFVVARSTSHWSWRGKISGAARVSIPDFHPSVGPILRKWLELADLIIDFRRDHPRLEIDGISAAGTTL